MASLFLLACPMAAQQSDTHFIEVSGVAARAVVAEEYVFTVATKGVQECNIEKKGRNWEKELKNCKEENNKLLASRQQVMAAVLTSMGKRLEEMSRSESPDYSGMGGGTKQTIVLKCRNHGDFEALQKTLFDADQAGFDVEMKFASVADNAKVIGELTIEALADARGKADRMAAVLDNKVVGTFQIFEREPNREAGFLQDILRTEAARRNGNVIVPEESESPYFPDGAGKLHFSKKVLVRFLIN